MSTDKLPKKSADIDDIINSTIGKKKRTGDRGGDAPTNADKGSGTPTMSDIGSDTPTTADVVELVRVTARISKQHRERLEAIARRDGRLLSDVIREAVRRYLGG